MVVIHRKESCKHFPGKTRHIDPMLVYCWGSVADGRRTVNLHFVDVSRLLGLFLTLCDIWSTLLYRIRLASPISSARNQSVARVTHNTLATRTSILGTSMHADSPDVSTLVAYLASSYHNLHIGVSPS